MTVRRVMGIETEYGISTPGHPTLNSMMTSTRIVSAYAQRRNTHRSGGWDYALESPLRDARGYDMTRTEADPSQLTDEDLSIANTILTNGARLYVDHAHPEYSSPEVTNPLDAVLWDRAGVRVMQEAMSLASQHGEPDILLYKNNTDNKGASYGCHENYLMSRETPFAEIVRHLVPFFVTRQVFAGAGRLGIGQDGRIQRYQMSQRADFFETEVGLETTLKRPIINTRDEPHADPEKYRRLHVIVGDANMSDTATFLKMGSTAIVLTMLEAGALDDLDLWPRKPVDDMHRVSHDTSLTYCLRLENGRSMTALEIQETFISRARDFYAGESPEPVDELTTRVLDVWSHVVEDLRTDPRSAKNRVDWVAKLDVIEGLKQRGSLPWDSPRLQLVDLQYSDIRPDKGLAFRLEDRGALHRLFDDEAIERATSTPPTDTRAYFRGRCIGKFGDNVAAASWDSVVFDIPGRENLVRVPTIDPLRGTQIMVGSVIDAAGSADALVTALSGGNR